MSSEWWRQFNTALTTHQKKPRPGSSWPEPRFVVKRTFGVIATMRSRWESGAGQACFCTCLLATRAIPELLVQQSEYLPKVFSKWFQSRPRSS